MADNTALGQIEISPTAIATIAAQSVTQAYGVVGLATKNLADSVARALSGDTHRGVIVTVNGDRIEIDLYVIIEYGTRIAAVAASVQNLVRFNVEKALGVPVTAVNVHVQALRVSSTDV
ncbi:MAG TPA: Asp23/Gls24 family envelope stress response protein [Anaerolineae bacterium]|nr:Asp23/Gls24 family envelope stress response protein [Anaerolineae bacterium]